MLLGDYYGSISCEAARLWALPLRLAFSVCIYPVWVAGANIKIGGFMPKFGKQLLPCLPTYLFISECSLRESVISSSWEGGLKYTGALQFYGPAINSSLVPLQAFAREFAKISMMQMCCCVFFLNIIRVQLSLTNSSFLYHTTVPRQICEFSKCAWSCYSGNLPPADSWDRNFRGCSHLSHTVCAWRGGLFSRNTMFGLKCLTKGHGEPGRYGVFKAVL